MSARLSVQSRENTTEEVVGPVGKPGGVTVLFIVPQPFFCDRGSPLRVRNAVRALVDNGVAVELLVFSLGAAVNIPGVVIHRTAHLPFISHIPIGLSLQKVLFDVMLFLQASLLCWRRKYQTLHGVEEGGVIAAFLGRLTNTPYIFDMHSWMSEYLRSTPFARIPFFIRLVESLEKWSIRGSAAVITVGQEHAANVQSLVSQAKAFSLEDLPIETGTPEAALIENLTNEFSLQRTRVVLYTGNFEPYQGLDLLLAAWKKTHDSWTADRPPVKLLLVGGGQPSASSRVVHYQKMVDDLGVAESVTFAGQRSSAEMNAFMALADVLVSPRISGGNTPLKVYCYMAAQKPIVATRISSHTQILSDESALLAEPNPEVFSKALLTALSVEPADVIRQRSVAAAARRLIDTRHNYRNFRTTLNGIYQAALRRPTPLR